MNKSSIVMFGIDNETKVKATKEEHGGKGFGLLSMAHTGLPIPPGIVIPTTYCMDYLSNKIAIDSIVTEVMALLNVIEHKNGYMPLMSVRSGARVSMPGMMDTILNVGLNYDNVSEWEKRIGKKGAWDSLRRLQTMVGDVVYGLEKSWFQQQVKEVQKLKLKLIAPPKNESQLSIDHHKKLVAEYDNKFDEIGLKAPTTMSLTEQLKTTIGAVFESWNNPRAKEYRNLHGYSDHWGTAVVIQSMVFGNMNDSSGSGVLFTRCPATGENKVTGEFLVNAQGEDVVAGTRTPIKLEVMEEWDADLYKELIELSTNLEITHKEVQDVEFTIQDSKIYILQTRSAKRTARAAFKIAVDMHKEGILSKTEAIRTIDAKHFREVDTVVISPSYKGINKPDLKGLPASTGVVTGKVVFTKEKAIELSLKYPVVLVSKETTPDDLTGMVAAIGIITTTGGATAHAAVVARSLNKPCVVGCSNLRKVGSKWKVGGDLEVKELDTVTLDGSSGKVWFNKKVPLEKIGMEDNLIELLGWGKGTIERVLAIKDIYKGSYYSVSSIDKLSILKKIIAELPTGIEFYLDLRTRRTTADESDEYLSNLFGVDGLGPSEKIACELLATRLELVNTVTVICSATNVNILKDNGFKVIDLVENLDQLLEYNGTGAILTEKLYHTLSSSAISNLLQLFKDADKEVKILQEPMTKHRQVFELVKIAKNAK